MNIQDHILQAFYQALDHAHPTSVLELLEYLELEENIQLPRDTSPIEEILDWMKNENNEHITTKYFARLMEIEGDKP